MCRYPPTVSFAGASQSEPLNAAVVRGHITAAGYLGMSFEVLLNTHGHRHPHYLSDAVEKIAVRKSASERKAHLSGAVIPLRRKNSW